MSIDDLRSLMDAFDPASLLPDLGNLTADLASLARLAVMVGPVVMLVLGLAYLFLAPKEANYHFGYRCYFGMGSVEAWRYTQRMAGLILGALGLVLTVVMFFVSADFAGKAPFDAMTAALTAVIWEGVLTLAAVLTINTLAAVNFTADGEIRRRKTK